MILSITLAAALALSPQQPKEVQDVLASYDQLVEVYGDCAHGEEGRNDACDRLLDSNDMVPHTLEKLKAQLEVKGWFTGLPEDTRKEIMRKHRKLSLYTLMIQTRREQNLARNVSPVKATTTQ